MGNGVHKSKHPEKIHSEHDSDDDQHLDYDPRSPSSRTPVANLVKERKASIVPFHAESPHTPMNPVDYDPRSPSSRTPVAELVKERKLSVVEFNKSEEPLVMPMNENQTTNKPTRPDLQKIAVFNAHKKAQESEVFPLS